MTGLRTISDASVAGRRGRIDEVEIESLDVVALNDGIDPWGGPWTSVGFTDGREHFRETISKWGFSGIGRVADLASGFGRWSIFLAEANDLVVGYEFRAEAVRLSEKVARHVGLENLRFERADVTNLPAPDGSFEGAWFFAALHFLDRRKALSETRRILLPGGRAFVGWFPCVGLLMEWFCAGYQRSGLDDRQVLWVLEALERPLGERSQTCYLRKCDIPAFLDDTGFELVAALPVQLDVEPGPVVDPYFKSTLEDLPALAHRLRTDSDFAAAFARCPGIAELAPKRLHFALVRT